MLADLLSSEAHRSVEESGLSSSGNEPISSSTEDKDTASSGLIIDTSDPSAPASVVSPPPKEQRWAPVQRTGCVGVIWTKSSFQYLVYSADLNGREAFIHIFVDVTRKMNVGQWLKFDATLWKPEARYTIGRYTPIDEVIHAMPLLDSIIITCDVHVTNNTNEEPPLVESDFFGRVEDSHSLAAGLRSGLYSGNLVYSNDQKGATTGRWSLGFVNDGGF